ncbi:hypothetical protein IB238_04315 [Rhizobium sp. ARZ01]|uniref:hypothetical protein n=1 Tax=Rhizobium sp. ARZ01 TaxID=2769313 RepID=UPI00178223DD|nr:hypothetical protein [Rhizobium sp. ARZ01]MBD9371864.1 hypothetical protein [Rhizobium sp. ARZ01]
MVAGTIFPLDHVRLADRPLVVCDIDEVVLEFLSPFAAFLNSRGHDLLPRSFRLHGNIIESATGEAAIDTVVDALQEDFFRLQEDWQTPAVLAVETLGALGRDADIVFLTAMPPRHAEARRRLLHRIGLTFPLVATEAAKGPVVQALHRSRPLPLAFVDDIHFNHLSVQGSVPEALLVQLMANQVFRAMAPDPGEKVLRATDWRHAERLIRAHFARPPF